MDWAARPLLARSRLRLGMQPWEALPALGTSKLKNIQLFLWDGLLARPINWAGFLAHPTKLDNLFVGNPLEKPGFFTLQL